MLVLHVRAALLSSTVNSTVLKAFPLSDGQGPEARPSLVAARQWQV